MQLTAGNAFTHRLRSTKQADHKLVTWGIYRYLRHPAYLGWFLWSVGTQALLCNLACLVAFVLVVRGSDSAGMHPGLLPCKLLQKCVRYVAVALITSLHATVPVRTSHQQTRSSCHRSACAIVQGGARCR